MKQQEIVEKISIVLVAAGLGKRLGASKPKAFVPLGNHPLYYYSLHVFDQHPRIHEIVLVIPNSVDEIVYRKDIQKPIIKPFTIVTGGKDRWQSVQNGVRVTNTLSEWILVHDAARPFVTTKIIDDLLEKRTAYECVITATPLTDTVRTFEHDYCIKTIDRSSIIRVGTPQLFNRQSLLRAFNLAESMNPIPTDEAMLMEKCGVRIGFAWGDPLNFKITTQQDWDIAKKIIETRR